MRANPTQTRKERRLLGILAGSAIALIVLLAVFSQPAEDADTTPSMTNPGSHGARAAYLLAPRLGYRTQLWQQPLSGLDRVDATHTTLLLADPSPISADTAKRERSAVHAFLERGGHVLATGMWGAELLSTGSAVRSSRPFQALCYTRPVGHGPLAETGPVPMEASLNWKLGDAPSNKSKTSSPTVEPLQRCALDNVVVRMRVGKGEAIWWAAATPLTNHGLRDDPSLRLLLRSLGSPDDPSPRTLLFDEYIHGEGETAGDFLVGLPIETFGYQCVFVAALLVFSFSRRRGPQREPSIVGRTSPLEFAWSMGALYGKARSTAAPIGIALRRLQSTLTQRCTVPAETLAPGELAPYLTRRFGPGEWSTLERDMQRASELIHATPSKAQALQIVNALDRHTAALESKLRGSAAPVSANSIRKARSA